MKKKVNKKLIYIFSLVLILAITLIIIFINTHDIKDLKYIEKKQQAYSNNELIGDNAIISETKIIKKQTGTGPWDENDDPGNDSSENNNVVRSFDQITWTLENTISLKTDDQYNSYSGGTIEVKAEVPESAKNLVKWDIDSMKWAQKAEVSEDGRIFTAQYEMPNTEITIPGKQTLVFVLKVLGAQNSMEIVPTFSLNLLGNEIGETIQITDSATIVSAAPKYNVNLVKSTLDTRKTLNFDGNEKEGRVYGYGIVLQLYNDNISKGMKGIEYPKGDISFDIDLLVERSKFDSTNAELEDITDESLPILWNYKINGGDSVINNRSMEILQDTANFNLIPNGIRLSDRNKSIYNSGDIYMEQKGRKLKVTISNYDFDGTFPTYTRGGSAPAYTNNIGCFNSSYFQIFLPDTEATLTDNRNYYLTVSDTNFIATSSSGIKTTIQQNTSDDIIRQNYVRIQKGHYNHEISLLPQNKFGNNLR